MAIETLKNTDSWIPLAELGKQIPPYNPTFLTNGQKYINEHHAFYATCPSNNGITINIGIPGWQRREDALKLYELAFYVNGDILELGCFHGLSSAIMAQSIDDSTIKKSITSVDTLFRNLIQARKNLNKRRLKQHVHLKWGDARKVCRKLVESKRKFGLVFVDDWHSYDSVIGVCRYLPDLLQDGGFCLFHDYNDAKNTDPNNLEYGVPQAITDGLTTDLFDFYGIFGCSALYRKKPTRQ